MHKKTEELIESLASIPRLKCEDCPGKNRPDLCRASERQFCTLAIHTIFKTIEYVYKDEIYVSIDQ
jgi:hypothetical protein